MKKSRGILSLIVAAALIVLLGFTTIVGFGKGHTGSMKNIKLGLDLAGGVSITHLFIRWIVVNWRTLLNKDIEQKTKNNY